MKNWMNLTKFTILNSVFHLFHFVSSSMIIIVFYYTQKKQ